MHASDLIACEFVVECLILRLESQKMCLHMDGADENSVLRLSTDQSKIQTSEG